MSKALDDAVATLKIYKDYYEEPDQCWSDADILEFQRSTGLSLPRQLEDFYRRYGVVGLSIGELYFSAVFSDGAQDVAQIQFIANRREQVLSFHETFKDPTLPDRLPPNFIVFGTAEGGNSFMLADGKNAENDAVYYWPLAFDSFGEGDNERGLAKASGSLAEFIAGLKPEGVLN